jgi:hypothetical protein
VRNFSGQGGTPTAITTTAYFGVVDQGTTSTRFGIIDKTGWIVPWDQKEHRLGPSAPLSSSAHISNLH